LVIFGVVSLYVSPPRLDLLFVHVQLTTFKLFSLAQAPLVFFCPNPSNLFFFPPPRIASRLFFFFRANHPTLFSFLMAVFYLSPFPRHAPSPGTGTFVKRSPISFPVSLQHSHNLTADDMHPPCGAWTAFLFFGFSTRRKKPSTHLFFFFTRTPKGVPSLGPRLSAPRCFCTRVGWNLQCIVPGNSPSFSRRDRPPRPDPIIFSPPPQYPPPRFFFSFLRMLPIFNELLVFHPFPLLVFSPPSPPHLGPPHGRCSFLVLCRHFIGSSLSQKVGFLFFLQAWKPVVSVSDTLFFPSSLDWTTSSLFLLISRNFFCSGPLARAHPPVFRRESIPSPLPVLLALWRVGR